jgi:acyl-CoA dehydrogenase
LDFQLSEQHVAIDEGVRKVCAGFDDAYWTECEENARFPDE